MTTEDSIYMTAEEVARLLRTPLQTIYYWRQTGYGPAPRRVGRRLLFSRSEVLAWVEQQLAVA